MLLLKYVIEMGMIIFLGAKSCVLLAMKKGNRNREKQTEQCLPQV